MRPLTERIANFTPVRYQRVPRDAVAYVETEIYQTESLTRLLELYSTAETGQRRRLIRDDIDDALRRFHGYNIQGNPLMGSHYVEIKPVGPTEFEHVLPNCIIRDMLIGNHITIREAFHAPTCLLSASKHAGLRRAGLGNRTPSVNNFLLRYTAVYPDIVIATCRGDIIDAARWGLDDHYRYFEI
jgi:hypothetical protein